MSFFPFQPRIPRFIPRHETRSSVAIHGRGDGAHVHGGQGPRHQSVGRRGAPRAAAAARALRPVVLTR